MDSIIVVYSILNIIDSFGNLLKAYTLSYDHVI